MYHIVQPSLTRNTILVSQHSFNNRTRLHHTKQSVIKGKFYSLQLREKFEFLLHFMFGFLLLRVVIFSCLKCYGEAEWKVAPFYSFYQDVYLFSSLLTEKTTKRTNKRAQTFETFSFFLSFVLYANILSPSIYVHYFRFASAPYISCSKYFNCHLKSEQGNNAERKYWKKFINFPV